ncbi:hypothetical protein LOTGIDRAFT_161161 [Lottia gigantea]|uniref:Uncharacterized protein n=1 Tax=Lottia gigantea TaxID=225164 RepID=V4AH28_LOTGI|nr:hypothetical protein LOTGIDRAFT_161161 [Lottia gigantea]ESO94465.1 hypothetical protein LOTGIDRAFT_161161 [Lottia gigantea]
MNVQRPKSAFSIRGPSMTLCDVIRCGYYKHVGFLVEMGIVIDESDQEGKTPLILCAFVEPESWGVGLARILIEHGAQVSKKDRFGLNTFHYACIYGRFQLAKALLNAMDFDINDVDRYGNTALHYTVRSGNSMITKLIVDALKRYNLPLDTRNRHGQTALELAYKLNRYSCVKLLEDDDTFEIPCEDTNLVLGFENKRQGSRRCYRECCRSAPSGTFGRNSYNTIRSTKNLKANQKDPERLIHSASAKDFRNTPENIFKLTSIPVDECNSRGQSRESAPFIRPDTAFARSPQSNSNNSSDKSWRNELRNLYLMYEYQCCPSWRRPIKPVVYHVKIEEPPADLDEVDKVKDKRNRRSSCTSRLSLNLDLRRRSSSSPRTPRKGSTTNVDKRSPFGDNLSSSSESSARSKRDGLSKNEISPRSPRGSPKHLDVDSVFN